MLLAINFSTVFHSATDQKQHKVGKKYVDPGEIVILNE